MLFDPRFHLLQCGSGYGCGQGLKQQAVGMLALHDLQTIQNLAMRGSLPNCQNHRLSQPAFSTILMQCAHPAMHFHRPLGGLHGDFRRPVLCQVGNQPNK